ncbi:hypothetical protein AB6A40_001098 [Gnathostoma spinigerum]|uniref:Secreted protein n=1 Tax=Gnathostoma spinigerum TaxID=75299 RepID=A0ABD6EAL0_9BILA
MMQSIAVLVVTNILYLTPISVFSAVPSLPPSQTIEPMLIDFNTTLTFYENETRSLVRTKNIRLDYRYCLEYRVKIEGRRSRLRTYACRMSSGGRCTYGEYRGAVGTFNDEHCDYIRAWMYRSDWYAFFFAFERRPRNFRDETHRRRYLRRLRKRHVNVKVSLILGGIKRCEKACG